MFTKILVANRGEIAIRIMRTLKKMGIKSVAVYSEADADALHVQYADEAYFIGQASATDSYLSINNIIKAVHASKAQAVHPGYGFLSENAKFATQLEKGKISLIGPSVKSIKDMGDKIAAKKIASSAGVSTIPGYMGHVKDANEAIKIAKKIGFPVMIKAAAGGGGKGIRLALNTDEMADAFNASLIDAQNNYLDDRVFIEKFIHNKPRHIEIQVLADKYGNVVCLGERECSIQRSHQKVIEEAPSIFLDEKTRKKMYKQAQLLVKKVGYYSAGTIEFIVDADKNFYFLEMNTRLQVEHTVTELVTGIDIVEQMIKIAYGEKLPFTQEEINIKGWAIECRICSEDPRRGFLPSSGTIIEYHEPKKSGIRIDSSIVSGSEVSMYYDSMIAKLCTTAPTRQGAIELMKDALGSFVIKGISHNINFLEALISHEKFISGEINTNFIKEQYPKGFEGAELTSYVTEIFLAAGLYIFLEESKRNSSLPDKLTKQPFKLTTRWIVKIDGSYFPLVIRPISNGYHIRHLTGRIDIQSNWIIGTTLLSCIVNGASVHVALEKCNSGYKLHHGGTIANVNVMSPRIAELESFMENFSIDEALNKEIVSPLSGQIISIMCSEGDEVKKGKELITLIAMKMQNSITAMQDGIIKAIYVRENQTVTSGTKLLEFE